MRAKQVLIVIAIVVIAAALMVPMLIPRKATALSNLREVARAELLYQEDHDGSFVPVWVFTPVAPDVYSPHNWPVRLLPYLKSAQAFVNPDTGDWREDFTRLDPESGWDMHAQFGYNYTFLAPLPLVHDVYMLEGEISLGRSSSLAVRPAQTVLFVSSQSFPEKGDRAAQFKLPDSDLVLSPGTLAILSASTHRLILTGAAGPDYLNGWVYNSPEGVLTSDVRCGLPNNGAYVAWLDGHVSINSAYYLAQGTDFATSDYREGAGKESQMSGNPPTWKRSEGFGSNVTDVSKYLWTLDGTLNDIR